MWRWGGDDGGGGEGEGGGAHAGLVGVRRADGDLHDGGGLGAERHSEGVGGAGLGGVHGSQSSSNGIVVIYWSL